MKGWLRSTVGMWGLLLAALVLPGLALASVGKVSVLEGTATRTNGPESKALEVGSEIELNDTLDVGKDSNLKLTLNDESVLMLAAGSQLIIDEATFEGQDRKGFLATLSFGKVWAKVKKALAGSESKFEVKTKRAVAGVRGTIFRVDYGETAKAMMPAQKLRMVVRVVEGRVVVAARIAKKMAQGQTPPASGKAQQGERRQVAPPQEITAEQWEEKFIELKAQQQVELRENTELTGPLDTKAMKDDFGRFVDKHQ